MEISTQIVLADGDQFSFTAESAAQAVLEALNADPNRDIATVNIVAANYGESGTRRAPGA